VAVDDVRVMCGEADLGTPDSVRIEGTLAGEAAVAFEEAATDPVDVVERVFRAYAWRSAVQEEGRMVLFGHLERGGQQVYANLVLEESGSSWRAVDWSECSPRVVADGYDVAAVYLDPDRLPEAGGSQPGSDGRGWPLQPARDSRHRRRRRRSNRGHSVGQRGGGQRLPGWPLPAPHRRSR
jgi:hypothetical protein